MSSSLGANTTSLAESSSKLVFPAEAELQNIIPLWMKFYCYEYSSTALGRAAAYNRSGGGASIPTLTKEKAQILIPAPSNFTSSTAHNYTNQPTTSLTVFPSYVGDILDGIKKYGPDAFGAIGDMVQGIQSMFNMYDSMTGYLTGMNSMLNKEEIFDAQYTPSGPSRTYEIRVNMPCLSERDSRIAGAIIRAFEALSLPTMRSIFGSATNTKYYHPPLWVFGIGPVDSFKFDPDWTGYPQISVLRSVSHKKTAYDTNSLSALGHQGLLKPVAYTLTLIFQELEPAFRQTNPGSSLGLNIINRSTGIVTTGTTVAARVVGE